MCGSPSRTDQKEQTELKEKLSHISCPLCGKNSSFSSFKPERLDDDIYLVAFTGLGRGKGFEIKSKESVFDSRSDDDIPQRIGKRALRIVSFLKNQGILDDDQILKALDMKEEEVSDDEVNETVSELQTIEDELGRLARLIALELHDNSERWGYDTNFGKLRFGVIKLIDAYRMCVRRHT